MRRRQIDDERPTLKNQISLLKNENERLTDALEDARENWSLCAEGYQKIEIENATLRRENALQDRVIRREVEEADQLKTENAALKRENKAWFNGLNVYATPWGGWAFAYAGVISVSDGYETKADAIAAALLTAEESE